MYSTSTGQKLSQLPDLDAQHSAPREPLRRKSRQAKSVDPNEYYAMMEYTRSIPMTASVSTSSAMFPVGGASSSASSSPTVTSSVIPVRKPRTGGRGKKPPHELLSEAQKKANHIASEQKRRANIRIGFDQLTDIVPTLSHCHRSESLILQKSYDYIQQLLDNKSTLKDRIRELQMILGDAPDEDSSDEDDEYIM